MAPQFNLPAGRGPVGQNLPTPNVDFNPAPVRNPFDAALAGVETGQSLGLARQKMALLQQEEKQKEIEDQLGLVKGYADLHEKYSDMPAVQRANLEKGFIPAHNKLMDLTGPGEAAHIDGSTINFNEDTAPIKEVYANARKLANKEISLSQYHQNLNDIENHHSSDKKFMTLAEQNRKNAMDMAAFDEKQQTHQQANADRDEARQLRVNVQRTDLTNKFNGDPSVKKSQQSLDASGDIRALATSGNPIAASAIPTYAARMSGEVGNLSEADKRPFGGSQATVKRIEASLQQMKDGKLTPENQKFIIDLSNIIDQRAQQKMDKIARSRAKQWSQGRSDFKEEDLYNSFRPGMDTTAPGGDAHPDPLGLGL